MLETRFYVEESIATIGKTYFMGAFARCWVAFKLCINLLYFTSHIVFAMGIKFEKRNIFDDNAMVPKDGKELLVAFFCIDMGALMNRDCQCFAQKSWWDHLLACLLSQRPKQTNRGELIAKKASLIATANVEHATRLKINAGT